MSSNKQRHMKGKARANIVAFETEEQVGANQMITSNGQPLNNGFEDEQVCIYDYNI